MTRETGTFTIEHNGEKFSGNYREIMTWLNNARYDTSIDALNRKFGNIKDYA